MCECMFVNKFIYLYFNFRNTFFKLIKNYLVNQTNHTKVNESCVLQLTFLNHH